ncbi:translation elongation factor Ts [Chamaesiphon sp. VAR_69_metabat_338]|uniref:translation elongation factor Ts n=1 Tax=Chamaesiphon sp. VAR_69_metabat_338 TaxID=2964704 RepID=UPI00286D9C25|nr:translation elongation factor Ts [Chamaesiphon sp. VAR_69_metabat_338]
MAEITAKMVQELRRQTGAGMMDCKKALGETEGDLTKASEWLRQKGMVAAGKKSDRVTAEGLVDNYIQADGKAGVSIEVNCQTDFVARNDAFKDLVQSLAHQAISADSVDALLEQPYAADHSIKVSEAIVQSISKIGENLNVRRLANYRVADGTQGAVDGYIHTGGRVGVLLELGCASAKVADSEDFKALARNLAMQVAACPNVEYINVSEIPEAIASKEKEIEMGRDDIANKPDNIKQKIVQGRIDKRLKEMTLVDQPYIKDQNISVTELIAQTTKQLGEDVTVRRFTRFILGEGIEKVESNFADEVAAQMSKM